MSRSGRSGRLSGCRWRIVKEAEELWLIMQSSRIVEAREAFAFDSLREFVEARGSSVFGVAMTELFEAEG